jgi:hypothetical protein
MAKKGGGKTFYKAEEEEEGEGSEEVITEIKTTVIRKKSKNKKSYGYYMEDDEGEEQQISGVYVSWPGKTSKVKSAYLLYFPGYVTDTRCQRVGASSQILNLYDLERFEDENF